MNHRFIATMATASVSIAGVANAANVNVSADITTSVTWTADNVYNLVDQIYVQPGATLTIEPGGPALLRSGLGAGPRRRQGWVTPRPTRLSARG